MAKRSGGSSGSAVLKTPGKVATPVTPGATGRAPGTRVATPGSIPKGGVVPQKGRTVSPKSVTK